LVAKSQTKLRGSHGSRHGVKQDWTKSTNWYPTAASKLNAACRRADKSYRYTEGMLQEPDPRITALLGAALLLMVESGVATQALGAFALEYPGQVAQILGEPLTAPELHIEDIIRAVVAETLESLGLPLLGQKTQQH